jgi:hypothetical protein
MFTLAVTVCLSLDANSCSTIISKYSFLDEPSCKEFALKEYPALLQSFPLVAALQCLPMPGENA